MKCSIIFLLIGIIVSTNGAAIIQVEQMGMEQHPVVTDAEGTMANPTLDTDGRGLFADFYRNKTQTATSAGFPGESDQSEDFGDAFTHAVLKISVALADTGIQAMQQILKTTGDEMLEAIRMKRDV